MARKKLKLFVWHGVLTDWTDGIAFAYAASLEEAVKLLKEQHLESHFDGTKLDGVEAIVYESPMACYVCGGG
jgi:hypothetical protein